MLSTFIDLNLYSLNNYKALLEAHDQIAVKDFLPQLPEIPYEVDEDEESVKVVRLVKGSQEPLVSDQLQKLTSVSLTQPFFTMFYLIV